MECVLNSMQSASHLHPYQRSASRIHVYHYARDRVQCKNIRSNLIPSVLSHHPAASSIQSSNTVQQHKETLHQPQVLLQTIRMQFITIVLAFLSAASTSLATPVPEPAADVSMMAAAGTTWTIQNFKRTCAADAKSCNYSFAINTNNGQAATNCAYRVNGNPAARASYNSVACGPFKIGSTWSNQFGAGQEFQTLSVVRNKQ